MSDPSWQQVVLQGLNVIQTCLLAYLAAKTRQQATSLEDIAGRSHRARRADVTHVTPRASQPDRPV